MSRQNYDRITAVLRDCGVVIEGNTVIVGRGLRAKISSGVLTVTSHAQNLQ
jgi:hypothetical protein